MLLGTLQIWQSSILSEGSIVHSQLDRTLDGNLLEVSVYSGLWSWNFIINN